MSNPRWHTRRLGDVVELVNGRGFKPDEWARSGLPIIRIQNLNGNSEFNYYDGDYNPKIEVNHGDLLFAWSGSRGSSFGPHFWWGQKAVLNYHTWKVVPRGTEFDPGFLHAALVQLTARIEANTHGFKTNFVHAKKCEVEEYSLPVPRLSEQKKIAAILATWDRAIELTEKLIAAKQKRKQALMQQLLTGKVRFEEFVKSRDVFETRYGDYPKDWKYVRIEKIAKQVSVKNSGGESHQVLSCTKHDGLVDSLGYFGKQIFSDNLSTYKIVRRNEFAYATNHIEEGSIGYQDVCDVAVISPMYTVFTTNDRVDDGYLYKLLKSSLYIHIYQVNTSASVDRRGSLRWTAFSHIRVPLPSLKEQRAIAAVLDVQQNEIDVLGRKRDALKRQKQGLMQQLLTGKKRVEVTCDD